MTTNSLPIFFLYIELNMEFARSKIKKLFFISNYSICYVIHDVPSKSKDKPWLYCKTYISKIFGVLGDVMKVPMIIGFLWMLTWMYYWLCREKYKSSFMQCEIQPFKWA